MIDHVTVVPGERADDRETDDEVRLNPLYWG